MRNRSTARRLLSAALAAALTAVLFPSQPVRAVSTSREIQAGQEQDKQITQQYEVLKDPLLTQWARSTGEKLWNQTVRKDVPYNIKILDTNDVNAFSTLGGYIYINSGTLDFVQSDDELAGVIGHETGHIERRHAVTYPAKAEALSLLLAVASLLSPVVGGFGQAAEAGVLAKASRTQEVQADRYGLLLMSRAGYDPDAMVSFMNHLGAAHAENDDDVDKYLADHPGFSERVARLVGYSELDPKKRTNEQMLVQALRDAQAARYAVAAAKFRLLLQKDPDDAGAFLHLGEMQTALGLPHKAEQSFSLAAAHGSAGTRTQALAESTRFAESLNRFTHAQTDIPALRRTLDEAIASRAQTSADLAQHKAPAEEQSKALASRLRSISYDAPNLAGVTTRPNSRGGAIMKSLAGMSRSINTAFEKSTDVLAGIGSLERDKENGLLKDEGALLREMRAPLQLDVVPEQSLAVLPYYPSMLADLNQSDEDALRAVDASRSALTLLDAGANDLNEFLHRLKQIHVDSGSDVPQDEYTALQPFIARAGASLRKAADVGAQAWQYYNLARSRQLQTRITALGLNFPQERYATLRYALKQRLSNSGLDYAEMLRKGLTPGDVVSASVIAADTNTTPQAVAQEASATHRSVIDIANARGMSAFALEIFLGLVYLDYTDDPVKEANDVPSAAPTIAPPSITERS